MEQRELFLCNSVYQVMVAVWIKHCYLNGNYTDIIITDHMNDGEKISKKIKEIELFDNVFYAETLEEARYKVKRNRFELLMGDLFPVKQMQQYVKLKYVYTDLYMANFDGFSQMLFNVLSRKNSILKLHVFEDGLSTYCEMEKYYKYFEYHYYNPKDDYNLFKRFLHKKIYRKKPLYGNVTRFLIFNPELMKWDPKCKVENLKKINSKDKKYCELVNHVFDYQNMEDNYNCKYIFFEESFYADEEIISDVELVEELAKRVGKENIMIKIHPRNPENRFAELGYKTNKNTSIPWEVILLNIGDVSDKVFFTIASSAILNPIMVFGVEIKAYSLYPCLKEIPQRLKGEAWDFLYGLFEKYSNMITLCEDIKEIN